MAGEYQLKEEIFKMMAEGDEIAFREIYDVYREPFYSAALKITHSTDLAEEIVQEVFVLIWEKRKLIGEAHNAKGYIFTILHNQISSHFRSAVMEKQILDKYASTLDVTKEKSAEDMLLDEEMKKILHQAIDKLPAQQKIIYKLAKIEGLSRKEIAQKLGTSPNTVRNNLAAAVSSIRGYLSNSKWIIIWIIIFTQIEK